jgi:hypothetical protein
MCPFGLRLFRIASEYRMFAKCSRDEISDLSRIIYTPMFDLLLSFAPVAVVSCGLQTIFLHQKGTSGTGYEYRSQDKALRYAK